ncbi:MAG: M3 family oligoendopeptidase, partial [Spirochaetaceae bacterium]
MKTGTRAGSGSPTAPSVIPRWSLESIYPGFDSPEFDADKRALIAAITRFRAVADDRRAWKSKPESQLKRCLKLINRISDLHETLDAYTYARYSVDTTDPVATRELNALQEIAVPMHTVQVVFRDALGRIAKQIPKLARSSKAIARYRFFLHEELLRRRHQMSAAEEGLAADLARSGADAWSRLQETVSATLYVPWKKGETKTVVELRGLAHDSDRRVRSKAFTAEIEAWKSVETPLAFAINGVKGHALTVSRRRGYASPLDRSVEQSRITQKALDALITAMREALPGFRDYLRAKARLLGLPALSFYDLFAPVGTLARKWSYHEARELIVREFGRFSPDLASFAEHAFSAAWIDAEPRAGKVGGAYCISMPLAGESRILANFDGSFSGVSTLAHELGHAWHHHLLRDAPALHREYPMTLAETASIFCETIVFDETLRSVAPAERITILELFLQDSTQVVVDILSRFDFERELFARRGHSELSASELCELMTAAQRATYGDALDQLHPYMWAVKGHYYRHDLAFYNYPYAFGLLFGLGLAAQRQENPDGFAERYQHLLRTTGTASAVEVTREAGFDIESGDFWRGALAVVTERVNEFTALADA